jgi:hypothetical protein
MAAHVHGYREKGNINTPLEPAMLKSSTTCRISTRARRT